MSVENNKPLKDTGLERLLTRIKNIFVMQADTVGAFEGDAGAVEISSAGIGAVASSAVATGVYLTTIAYGTTGISADDKLYVKMSDGAVYPAINNSTASQIVIFGASDLSAATVSKIWRIV